MRLNRRNKCTIEVAVGFMGLSLIHVLLKRNTIVTKNALIIHIHAVYEINHVHLLAREWIENAGKK